MAGATWNCCRLGAFCVHHTTCTMSRHFKQSHIRRVHACLAAACHLHFWQNGRGRLRATAVTRGWADTEIKVSTESWPWRSKFSRRSCRGSNPRPFNHESGALTTELSPLAWTRGIPLQAEEGGETTCRLLGQRQMSRLSQQHEEHSRHHQLQKKTK